MYTHTHTHYSPVALYNCLIAFKCSSKKDPWGPGPKSCPKYLPEATFGESLRRCRNWILGGPGTPLPPGPLKSALWRRGPKSCPKRLPEASFSESFGGGQKTVFWRGMDTPRPPWTHTHTLMHQQHIHSYTKNTYTHTHTAIRNSKQTWIPKPICELKCVYECMCVRPLKRTKPYFLWAIIQHFLETHQFFRS